jgi:hypothetical protein
MQVSPHVAVGAALCRNGKFGGRVIISRNRDQGGAAMGEHVALHVGALCVRAFIAGVVAIAARPERVIGK